MTEEELEETKRKLELVMADINRQYGNGSVLRYGTDNIAPWPALPTGALTLDDALGIGGLPKGRIVEIFGPESCLDKDSFVQYEVRTTDGKRQNHKGGTIEKLWHRFHGVPMKGRGGYQRPQTIRSEFFAACMNEEGRIFQNRIIDVVKTGTKNCLTVITDDGQILTATPEHKFFSRGAFIPLRELAVGDVVSIHNNTRFANGGKERDSAKWRKDIHLPPIHPVAGLKTVKDGKKEYTYSRIAESRAIFEAQMNGLTLEGYVGRFRSGHLAGMKFLDSADHVHHRDEDETNNNIENLVLISAQDHGRLHALDRHNNLRYQAVDAKIIAIVDAGKRETFDIKMESPFNNYVAEGFVVHNSGKSTLCMSVVAAAQAAGGICAYIDAEHAVDPAYARNLGVDMDELILCQPDYGEMALEVMIRLVRSGTIAVVIVDSVAALTPKAEIEGEMTDQQMGLLARMMSKSMRSLMSAANESQTLVIFTNQIREKIGVMFGNPEVTPGGRGLRFAASVRIDLRKKEDLKASDGTVLGVTTKAKVIKNKMAPPFKIAEFDILYGRGINEMGCIVDLAVTKGVLTKSGSWLKYNDESFAQGRNKAIETLASDLVLADKIKGEALAA